MDGTEDVTFNRPGWDLPFDHWNEDGCCKSIGTYGPLLTHREISMMGLVNSITDKAEWEQKVFDDGIVAKWKAEVLAQELLHIDDETFDWCILEVREKADFYKHKHFVPIFDTEFSAAKSDKNVSEAVRQELIAACRPLADVPEHSKDYHPFSNDQVLNLVHPSLFPLIYGRSRVLDKEAVPLADCSAWIAKGKILPPIPTPPPAVLHPPHHDSTAGIWSHKYQWLPSEVKFDRNGKARVESYINNLHPEGHEDLYAVLAKLVDAAIPLWSVCLPMESGNFAREADGQARIPFDDKNNFFEPSQPDREAFQQWENERNEAQEESGDDNRNDGEANEDDSGNDHSDSSSTITDEETHWKRTRELKLPCPQPYKSWPKLWHSKLDLSQECKDDGLQVIFKLASIELSPDKPSYPGGNWHVEGQYNEHIVATAIYYFDCENISESLLSFRQEFDVEDTYELNYQQDDHDGIWQVYGFNDEQTDTVHETGQVSTRLGRMLVFPNNYQHKVEGFRLEDETRPGHRRFVVLWLIDPWNRVLSTANVPPQQLDWWVPELLRTGALPLPAEITRMAAEAVDDFPLSLEAAKEIRLDLMKERTTFQEATESNIRTFNLCEH